MGKQISTYHQSSAVYNDSFCISFKVLNDSEKSVSKSVLLSTYMMLEQFGDNFTVTTADISKLTHFPPGNCVSLLLYVQPISGVPEGTIARISAIRLKAGRKSLLKKSKDGHVLNSVANTLFHITLTFHITLLKLSCFFKIAYYTHHF